MIHLGYQVNSLSPHNRTLIISLILCLGPIQRPLPAVGAGFIPARGTAGVCDPVRAGMNPAPTRPEGFPYETLRNRKVSPKKS
jgi:hypothetical protein